MKKFLFVTAVLFLFGSFGNAYSRGAAAIPEVSGTYQEPGRPGVEVRVIVHHAKPEGKGKPEPSSELVCGLTDPDSSAPIGDGGWRLNSNTTYNLNVGSVPSSVGSESLVTIVDNGFDDWSAATGGSIAFTRGADTTVNKSAYDGLNVITWGRTQGTALGVTYIRYLVSTGEVVDVDTIMNKKFTWKWSDSSTCAWTNVYDAENVMTHELGHWLGLEDEYTAAVENNTMYGYADKGEVKKNTITTGDAESTFALYN